MSRSETENRMREASQYREERGAGEEEEADLIAGQVVSCWTPPDLAAQMVGADVVVVE
jgi:hypothetical protein